MEKQKRSGITVITESVLGDRRLRPIDKLVYARIAYFKEFFEDAQKTADYFGVSTYAIQQAKRNLEEYGYIKCVKNTGRGKRYVSDLQNGLATRPREEREQTSQIATSRKLRTQTSQITNSDLANCELRPRKLQHINKNEIRNKIKKKSKKEKITYFGDEEALEGLVEDEELKRLLKEHLKLRALNHWPKLTYQGLQMSVTRLMRLANSDVAVACRIVAQSLEKGWRGFFPLDELSTGQSPPAQNHIDLNKI